MHQAAALLSTRRVEGGWWDSPGGKAGAGRKDQQEKSFDINVSWGFVFFSLFLIYTIKKPPLWHPVGRRSLTEALGKSAEARGDGSRVVGGPRNRLRPSVTPPAPGSFSRKRHKKRKNSPQKSHVREARRGAFLWQSARGAPCPG